MHTDADISEYEPAAHPEQADEPSPGANVPEPHDVQLAAIGALIVPAPQDEHADAAASENDPALHGSHAVLPSCDANDPEPQGVQLPAPEPLNVPRAQGVH